MNVEQARKELRDARNDVTWLWLKKKLNIMSEVMTDESNPEWVRKEAQLSYCIIEEKLTKLEKKMDNAADAAFIGEASDTPDTRKGYYVADKDSMETEQTVFNPEIEYDWEQLGELVYDPFRNQYTNEKGQIFRERADGCFVLIKRGDNNND